MPRTPDRFPGKRSEEALLLSGTEYPVSNGEVTFVSGGFWGKDDVGTFNLRSSGSLTDDLVTTGSHPALRQLIHLADGDGPFEQFGISTAYRETLGQPFVTSSIWYTSDSKTSKIVEKLIARNSNQTPSTITWKSYDTDGATILATVTDTIYYDGVFETHRSRSMT